MKSTLFLLVGAVASKGSYTSAFLPPGANRQASSLLAPTITALSAAPKRLDENVPGPLYVNDKCINCAACAQFAPTVFSRSSKDGAHVVHRQPETPQDITEARAALAACPVAAIRTETNAQRSHRGDLQLLTPLEEELVSQLAINPKFNGLAHPFPLAVSPRVENVHFVGHHSEATFGAVPYLVKSNVYGWILVDTPKFSKSAVGAVEKVTGPDGPSYMLLTHVDDTTGHNDWRAQYPNLKRIFHSGDLGRHNWLGDTTLEKVEVLLQEQSTEQQLQFFDLNGNPIANPTTAPSSDNAADVVLVHTPGHSPGSISLWKRPTAAGGSPGVIFTGDTYAFTTRDGGRMTSFPRYGNNRSLQSKILPLLAELDWSLVAPGHGHVRDYNHATSSEERLKDMQPAIEELQQWSVLRR